MKKTKREFKLLLTKMGEFKIYFGQQVLRILAVFPLRP